MLNRRWSKVHDEVHDTVGAHIAQPGSKQHRKNFVFTDGIVQCGNQIFFGESACVKEFFHQRIIALGDHFYEFFVRCLGSVFHVRRNLAFRALAASAELVSVGFHTDQIHHARKALLFTDRQLQRNHAAAKCVGQRLQHALGVGAVTVHAAGDNYARRLSLLAMAPYALGYDFNSGHAVHNDNGRIYHRQHHPSLVDKHAKTRRVEKINFGIAPLGASKAG